MLLLKLAICCATAADPAAAAGAAPAVVAAARPNIVFMVRSVSASSLPRS